MLLLFVLCCVATAQQWPLGDAHYALLGCEGAPNALASLSLSNDLLGETLHLQIDMAPFQSCFLCAQYPARYCNASVAPDHLYLTLDVASNVQVALLDSEDRLLLRREYAVESSRGLGQFASNVSLPLIEIAGECGAQLRLLVSVMLTLDEPANKDLFALAYDASAPALQCDPAYEATDLECVGTQTLYPLMYTVQSCVQWRESDPPLPPDALTQWSPLYWYHTLVMQNDTRLPPPLCGERADTLLFETRLYQQQCYGVAQDARCEWWDALLTRYVALWLDASLAGVSGNALVNASLEQMRALLERGCTRRQSCLVVALPRIADYYTLAMPIDNASLCAQLHDYFEANYAVVEQDWLALFTAWYRTTFRVLVYPSKETTTALLLFVMAVFFTLLSAVFAIGIAGFKMRVKVKKTAMRV